MAVIYLVQFGILQPLLIIITVLVESTLQHIGTIYFKLSLFCGN